MSLRRLKTGSADFADAMVSLRAWGGTPTDEIDATAARIVASIRQRGDEALVALTAELDGFTVQGAAQLALNRDDLAAAHNGLPHDQREALTAAAERITDYHRRQQPEDFEFEDALGNRLGQRWTPVERVGMYVPGGRAAYPSSVLMTAIPARVAGVDKLVMVVPTPSGERNALVLAAAYQAGVDQVFTIGGAQAVAALAFGTATIPKVDKIVGPGNAYVAAAKRIVFGEVGIDSIAGPSEVLVIADGSADPEWVALDLFSQAEHDPAAQSIVISPEAALLDAVDAAIERLLPQRARRSVIETSLADRGAAIEVVDLPEACELANRIAPEHLELCVEEPEALLPQLRHAGAFFVGAQSAEVFGDYLAGPSHVLPTFGTARFSSALGVYDFVKRSSIIKMSERGAAALAPIAARLAQEEGLEAHAAAALARLGSGQNE